MVNVAINGFGRIGRLVMRSAINDPEINFVAVNDLTDPHTLAHLLKYDSVHRKFPGDVHASDHAIYVNDREIKVFSEKDPKKLPWGELNVDVVIESTGIFTTEELAGQHLEAGAKKVLLSAPPKGGNIKTITIGGNDDQIHPEDKIVSNASCTTNSLVPVVRVLKDQIGIEHGFMTTIHSFTNDQRNLDLPHKDLRRARAASVNAIPTSTGAAKAIGLIFPELQGKLDGMAVRIPTPDGSFTDLTVRTSRDTSEEEVNRLIKEAADNYLKGILEYSEAPLVTQDIIGNSASSIFDSQLTKVIDKRMVKVCMWYDNEWGYSCRMVDMVKRLA